MLIQAVVLATVIAIVPVDFSGSYYQGDGTGVNMTLDLHSDGTFSFVWTGCVGTYDQKSGHWSVLDGLIYLDVTEEAAETMPDSLSAIYRPVHWGPRTYLVPADELQDFCNQVNEGSEPRTDSWGRTYLRRGDWSKSVSGRPELPQSAEPYLLQQPIRARIVTRIGPTSVRINSGSQAGLLPGMVLYDQTGDSFLSFRITATTVFTAKMETLYGEAAPKSGWVSSLLYDDSLRQQLPTEIDQH